MIWTRLISVASDSEPSRAYEIKQRSDGAYGCSCHAFRFSPGAIGHGKSCKHLHAFLSRCYAALSEEHALLATTTAPTIEPVVRAKGQPGEVFTFRRAISFGPT